MLTTEFKLEYNALKSNCENGIPVIIAAAGSSFRMAGNDKLFTEISGIPVLARTLLSFEGCTAISRIIIVTKADSILPVQTLCQKYLISKVTDIIEGGDNRHLSVMRGFSMLSPDENKVLIHDGARPLVTAKIISEVAEALQTFDAAVCSVFVNDTVKLANDNNTIANTLDRNFIRLAQTPQGVDVQKYIEACSRVDAASLTDDCAVMEKAGYTVKLTEGSRENIKITTKEDIPLAEFYLKGNALCE